MPTFDQLMIPTLNALETGRCFSSHLNRGKSKCDYHFHRDLTVEEVESLEVAVNEALARNLSVTEEFVSLEEAAKLVNTAKLPSEAQADPKRRIRLVRIGDYDLCPCIGAHVKETGQAAPFSLISHSFTEQDVLRLRFRVGKE